jgi:hypothetical protein
MTVKQEDLKKEYNEIVDHSNSTFIVITEWREEGDFFRKLSVYDDSYVPVNTLEGTTLLNPL